MAKTTLVELEVLGPKPRKEKFAVKHAERILGMTKNGGWKLPDISQWEFKDGVLNQKKTAKK